MTAGGTLAPLHYHALFGGSDCCGFVGFKKAVFGGFCFARANSTASKQHRLALYSSMLAEPSYHIMKELSHLVQVYAS